MSASPHFAESSGDISRVPISANKRLCNKNADTFAEQVESTQARIDRIRAQLNNNYERPDFDARALDKQLQAALAELPRLRAAEGSERRVLIEAKHWLGSLPADAILVPVRVATDGYDLADVRERIAAASGEISTLRAAPCPSADIRERVTKFVHELAQPPIIRGIGGVELDVRWPLRSFALDRRTTEGFEAGGYASVATLAWLFPELLRDRLLAQIEAEASVPLPPAERPARIAKLEAEIAELQRIEQALLEEVIERGGSVTRSPAPPWIVLGLNVDEKSENKLRVG
jgi:hypothetical protein